MNFQIKPNEHVTLMGKTGSGKTYFAQHALSSVGRLIVFDPKANLRERFKLQKPSQKIMRAFHRGDPARIQIVPPRGTFQDQFDFYETIFEDIYHTQDCYVYIDEVYRVTPMTGGYWFTSLYTQGRELNISMWCSTQRPSRIPQFILSEPEWLIAFRLNKKDDRAKAAETMGDLALNRIPDPHGFYLYNVNMDDPLYRRSLTVKQALKES